MTIMLANGWAACSASAPPADSVTSPDAASDPGTGGFGGSDSGLGTDAFASCATETILGRALDLDLFVMLDASGSMAERTQGGLTKWQAVSLAMDELFRAPESRGIAVSLGFFPVPVDGVPTACTSSLQCGASGPCTRRACLQAGPTVYCTTNADCTGGRCADIGTCTTSGNACAPGIGGCAVGDTCVAIPSGECLYGDRCDVAAYRNASLAALPAAAGALSSSIARRVLRGYTPTGPALAGAIDAALTRSSAAPENRVAVLFVTDGLPTSCTPTSPQGLANVAQSGQARGVPTYVVGVFAPADAAAARANLDVLARAGGTGAAAIVSTQGNVAASLSASFQAIREVAFPCEYAMPQPTQGRIDPKKVNVMRGALPLAQAADAAACGVDEGWYYARGADGAPASIRLCDASCKAVRAAAVPRVDVVLGCETRLK
jgi:hypothetical protein